MASLATFVLFHFCEKNGGHLRFVAKSWPQTVSGQLFSGKKVGHKASYPCKLIPFKKFLTLKLTDVGIFYIQLNNIFAMTFIFYCFNSVDRYYRNSQLVRTGPVRHM